MRLANLTQHAFTDEQAAGNDVVSLDSAKVRELITFNDLPSKEEIKERADELAEIAAESGASHAMIGGAPYLMGTLEISLHEAGIQPVYAFSQRESVDIVEEGGAVRKVSVFRHLGWVEA